MTKFKLALAGTALAAGLLGAGAHSASAQSFMESGPGTFKYTPPTGTPPSGSFSFQIPGTENSVAGILSGAGFVTGSTATTATTKLTSYKFVPTGSMTPTSTGGPLSGMIGASGKDLTFTFGGFTFMSTSTTPVNLTQKSSNTLATAPAPEMSSLVSFGGLLMLGGLAVVRKRRAS